MVVPLICIYYAPFSDLGSNNLTGILPVLPFAQYTEGCSLGNNSFTCPLPAGAAKKCSGWMPGTGVKCHNNSKML